MTQLLQIQTYCNYFMVFVSMIRPNYPKCVETRELSQISYVDSVSCYGVFTNRVIAYEWKFPQFVSNFRTTTYGYTENSNEKSSEIIQIRATRLN